jgi:hypothetical protein
MITISLKLKTEHFQRSANHQTASTATTTKHKNWQGDGEKRIVELISRNCKCIQTCSKHPCPSPAPLPTQRNCQTTVPHCTKQSQKTQGDSAMSILVRIWCKLQVGPNLFQVSGSLPASRTTPGTSCCQNSRQQGGWRSFARGGSVLLDLFPARLKPAEAVEVVSDSSNDIPFARLTEDLSMELFHVGDLSSFW